METHKTILKRRTVRIFQDRNIPKKILKEAVNVARMAPSARNIQPLEYLVVEEKNKCEKLFKNITFGGDIDEIRKKKNRPKAYILVLVNKKVRKDNFQHDVGLAVGNIALFLQEKRIGTCIMGAIDREEIAKDFKIPDHYFIDLVVALGYPAEKIKVIKSDKVSYHRDENNVLFVVKRSIDEIIHWNKIKK